MKRNMGTIDRALRILVAITIVGLYFTDHISGITATILLILAGIFILTGLTGFCALYLPFGLSTIKNGN